MSEGHRDDDLAYGSYRGQGGDDTGEEGERGFIGDTFNSLLGRKPQGQQYGQQSVSFKYTYNTQSSQLLMRWI